jgi:predicted protein tyrosine phosphatase
MKKVIFINRLSAERISPKIEDKASIISINSDDKLAVLHDNWVHKLVLIFHDLDKAIEGYSLFTEEQAKEIINFVAAIEKEINILVVHCDAGVSRSAAVAKFIAEKYGLTFQENYSIYNKHVYAILKYVDNGALVQPTEYQIGKYGSKGRFL